MTSAHSGRGGLLLGGVAIAVVALLLGHHLAWIDEPFDTSLGGTCAADDFGYSIQAFDVHGWRTLATRPAWFFRRSETATFVPYPNHPWLPYAWYLPFHRLGGRNEAALRLGSLPLLALALGGIALAAWRAAGPTFAWASLAGLALLPVMIQYGNLVDFSVFHPALVPWALWSWRRMRAGRGSPGVVVALGVAAGCTSWYAFALVPVFWWDRWLDGGSTAARLRSAAFAAAPFLFVLLAHGAWIFHTNGASWDYLEERLAFYLDVLHGADDHTAATFGRQSYAERMISHLTVGFGWPLGIAMVGGLLAAVRDLGRPSHRERGRLVVGLVLVGVVNAAALWSRIAAHEFLMLVFAPGGAVALARAVVGIAGWAREAWQLPVAALLLVVAAGVGFVQGREIHVRYGGTMAPLRAAAMAEHFPPDTVVLAPTADYESGLRYYCEFGYLPALNTPEAAALIARELAPGAAMMPRIAILVRRETLPSLSWLAQLPLRPETYAELDLAGRSYVTVDLQVPQFLASR